MVQEMTRKKDEILGQVGTKTKGPQENGSIQFIKRWSGDGVCVSECLVCWAV